MLTTNTRWSRAPFCALISTVPAPQKAGADQAIGRSHGGLSTKIHILVDALGSPIGFFLTGGHAHDLVSADAGVLLPMAAAGKTAVIPPRANRRLPRNLDKDIYKTRHLIENLFVKLKQPRAIATRHDKTARNFLAAVHLVAATIRLN